MFSRRWFLKAAAVLPLIGPAAARAAVKEESLDILLFPPGPYVSPWVRGAVDLTKFNVLWGHCHGLYSDERRMEQVQPLTRFIVEGRKK